MRKNPIGQKILSLLLVTAMIGGLWFLLDTRQDIRTENPYNTRNTESSLMYQEEEVSLNVDSSEFAMVSTGGSSQSSGQDEASESDTTEESRSDSSLVLPADEEYIASDESTAAEISEEISDTGSGTDSSAETSNPNVSGGNIDETPSNNSDTTSGNTSSLLPASDIPDGNDGVGDTVRETDKVYFTTNIINGSTVSTRELEVIVTHKLSYLTPVSTTIELVGGAPANNGTVILEEGQNAILVTVLYADQEGHQIEVSKKYTVYLELENVVITTDLTDRTINQRSFSFTAYASTTSERVPLDVTINGNALSTSGNRYHTTLNEGDNEIILSASTGQSSASFTAHILVELPENISILSDLYDHEVDNPNFTFYAAISGGTDQAALTVVANGETLEGRNDSYTCTLARGNNFIRLKATDVDGAEYTIEYTISYHNYIVKESYEADESMPKIITNLSDGLTLDSNIFSLQVRGEDNTGKRIYGDHLTVELNGLTLEDRSEDGNTTYYQLDLISGLNSVIITVWDYEDRYTIYRYSVYCNNVAEGERIGSITVSVQATTVGLGYLIPPTTVDIYQGDNLVVPVATVLEQAGFQYQYSGSLDNGFYLMHLIKSGITDGYHIPEDLEDAINADGLYWTNEYYTDSLGEHDFTQGSGWMYTLNGSSMPGMSDVYPSDGDVIELRYTLAYGRDIGLGIGSDGNDHNYSGEW